MGALPKSILGRSAELLKLAAKMGSEEISSRLASADALAKQLDQAKLLVDSLSRLKGAAMKFGQLLSMDFGDLFPEEVRQVLEQLQNSSPHFMSFDEVNSILARECRDFNEIENISAIPIAAASIGQVHRAIFRGQDIVLKIQYSNVSDSIDSDLKMMKTLFKSFIAISRKKIDIDPLFNELEHIFKQEANYLNEFAQLNEYRSLLGAHADYRVPHGVADLSTERVLAMSFEEGLSFREWVKTNPSLDRKRKMGEKILHLYSLEFFKYALVQTDPNPSNFLVDPENDQLILLDFGAVKKFERSFVKNYVCLMKAVFERNIPLTIEQAEKMQFLDPRETAETKEQFYKMLRSSLCAFDKEVQPFDFTAKGYFENTKLSSRDFGKMSQFTPPPFEIIFLHRKLVGIFGMLKDLRLDMDLRPFWNHVLELTAKD